MDVGKKDQHIVHMWEPLHFKVTKDYDYSRKGPIKSFKYYFYRNLVQGILNSYNHLFFGLKIQGKENIKKIGKKQGAVIISNHVHIFDSTIITSLIGRMRRIYFTTLESNFKIPVIRHLVKGLGGVPIPESLPDLTQFVKAMEKSLKSGSFVCMYPESVLYPYFEGIRDFKSGAFHLAVDTGCPILPLVITFRKPRGIYALYKKKPCITITALEPIFVKSELVRHEQIEELMSRSHKIMEAAVDNKITIPPSRRYLFGFRTRNIRKVKSKK